VLIRHLPDGTIYRLKSNALGGLAVGDGGGFGWATITGKATYQEPTWPEALGNRRFVVYIEDRNEPGSGVDRFWVQVSDKNRVLAPGAAYSAIQGVTVDPLRCPVLTVQAVGGGQAAHLGQFTSVQTHCVNPEGSDPLSFTDGFYTFTAANGDTIFGSYSGRLIPTETPGVFSLDGHFTVAAGTGRFEDASGSGSASGLVNLATGEASVFLQGTISSVGSEKA